MTPDELMAWQARVVGTGYGAQTRAAKLLNTPLQTYRNWLYGRVEVPSPVERLAEYVERYGALEDHENLSA